MASKTLNRGCCFQGQSERRSQRIQQRPGKERSSTSNTAQRVHSYLLIKPIVDDRFTWVPSKYWNHLRAVISAFLTEKDSFFRSSISSFELGVGCQVRNIVIVETIAIVWTARNSAGGGRGGRQWGFEVSSCHENHLLHLNQGPGANGDSRRRPRGKRGSPISPGRSSTDNARILWQFHEKITPRSGPCRRLRSPIAPGCFHRNQSDSEV